MNDNNIIVKEADKRGATVTMDKTFHQIQIEKNAMQQWILSKIRKNPHKEIMKRYRKKGKRKVQWVPQSQTAALPRCQEEEETVKTKQAQIEQTYEKH